MNRMAVLFLVALSACAGKQPLRVDCERELVPINEPVEQIDSSRREPQPKEEGRQQ
jgi:hypothetical protein